MASGKGLPRRCLRRKGILMLLAVGQGEESQLLLLRAIEGSVGGQA